MRVNRSGAVTVTVPLGVPDSDVERFINANIGWAEKAIEKMARRREDPNPLSEAPGKDEVALFIPKLDVAICRRSKQMNLYPRKITLRFMTSRWGSCRKDTASITFNSALCRVSEECMDYVVVHELAHLRHADHSESFWRFVEQFCPDWRRIRSKLR